MDVERRTRRDTGYAELKPMKNLASVAHVQEIEYRVYADDEPLTPSEFEAQMTHDMDQFYADFNGWVMYTFPWGEEGSDLELSLIHI